MSGMIAVALSLIPVFVLIALGAVLRRRSLLDASGWAALERLTYFVLFPPLLFMSIAGGSFAGGEALRLGMAMGVSVLTMAAVMLAARPLLPISGPQFSSVFQAGIRWNGYIALGVISGLHGEAGVGLAAVGFAVLVPINNLLSVFVLSRYAGSTPAPMRQIAVSVATNPLILSTVAASLVVASGLGVSPVIADTLNLLGDATIALGLICVGAALDFGSLHGTKLALGIGVAGRLLVMPAIAAGLGIAFGLSDIAFSIALICVTAPVATSAYILARQLGGDATLMASLISVTTLLSLLSLPATLLLIEMFRG